MENEGKLMENEGKVMRNEGKLIGNQKTKKIFPLLFFHIGNWCNPN